MESAFVPCLVGRKNRQWQSLMSISKVLMALGPAHRGLPSSPQSSCFATELCHMPGEVHLFSQMGLCSLGLLPELSPCLLRVYDDPLEKWLLGLPTRACTEST